MVPGSSAPVREACNILPKCCPWITQGLRCWVSSCRRSRGGERSSGAGREESDWCHPHQGGRQAWVLCPELALTAVEGQVQNYPDRDSGLSPRNMSTSAPGPWSVRRGLSLPRPMPGHDDAEGVMQSQVWATLRKTQLLYGAKLSDKTSGWVGGGLVSAHSFSHPSLAWT